MIVAGLTGGIATGKSTVAGIFASAGAVVVDADRIAREPGLSAKAKVTASEGAVNAKRANDQFEPESSDDAAGYMHWWPKKGTAEWIDYTFDTPVRVSESSVYWFDDTGGGGCRVPASWRILYKSGGEWLPVKAAGAYAVAKDAWNTVRFDSTGRMRPAAARNIRSGSASPKTLRTSRCFSPATSRA